MCSSSLFSTRILFIDKIIVILGWTPLPSYTAFTSHLKPLDYTVIQVKHLLYTKCRLFTVHCSSKCCPCPSAFLVWCWKFAVCQGCGLVLLKNIWEWLTLANYACLKHTCSQYVPFGRGNQKQISKLNRNVQLDLWQLQPLCSSKREAGWSVHGVTRRSDYSRRSYRDMIWNYSELYW